MKKFALLISTVVCGIMVQPCSAQENNNTDNLTRGYSNTGLHLGLRIQPQLSWMANKDDSNNDNYTTLGKFGLGFGIALGYNFDNHSGIELDALYSLQGKRYKVGTAEFDQQLSYIKIPLLYTYTTSPARLMFVGKIGPQFGIRTYAHIDPALVNGKSVADNREQFENLVMSGMVSAGARYTLTNSIWLDASLKYDMSFSNVEDNTYEHYPVGRAETYNIVPGIELSFSYHIP